eukprot:Protomagalhaensia_wolfi_Nauph_80__2075@NODE_2328_length_1125_cov_1489_325967_g1823_i0_p1_GENE_NODE_2328_length_1125_cov_1489_325967_g1823_i0NODE_2328_length_1125_cov_1489_325967_g1823_i0_p1_ORF_typecomplete_len286_score64_60Ribosomal_S5/PF00333_20/8e30Ribosomal_S5_C/PF03719_15/7e03Ribosomal_S5_C/PF03719_15/7_3e03Ribosomal_S5_C/PF03719_15/4_4e24zfC2H2_10/PF16588_5/0_15_NODE_2328_length_1125_cov_1489_325967_g1823_i01741031
MERGGRGGFGGGFGGERGMSGAPRRSGRVARAARRVPDEKAVWVPVTNLGRLVKAKAIKSIEEIFLHSLPIKEHQIVDSFFSRPAMPGQGQTESSGLPILKDEVMGIKPVQKQSSSGQRTRFKAFLIVGDTNGHFGFGVKCAKEVATAIRGAIIAAKLAIIPVRRGYWGNNIGLPHTVPMKVSGKCASVKARLIPAPRGAGIVGSPIAKKLLGFAGVHDCYCNTAGHTRTSGNFMRAYYSALQKTYGFLTPDLWRETGVTPSPFDAYSKKILEKGNERKEETVEA